jgi:hypothetical protein
VVAVVVVVVRAVAVETVAGAVAASAERARETLADRASQIGEAWALDYLRELREQERAPVGEWPGTMREARVRVRCRIATALDPDRLEELARVANLAARRGWRKVREPDLEP